MIEPNLIERAVRATLLKPFAWGREDCCTFACDVIRDATGRDLMARLRGAYASEAEVNALAEKMPAGFIGLADSLAEEAGLARVAFPFTGADIGVVATPQGPALALFVKGRFVARGRRGIIYLPAEAGVLAWSVA